MLIFSFSIFSDRPAVTKNEINNTKTLTAEAQYMTIVPRIQFIYTETYPGWLELPLSGINFRRGTEVLLYISLLEFALIWDFPF